MQANSPAAVTVSLRERFLADHDRIETLLEQLLAAFDANDREDIARLWIDFESSLLAHLEDEETYLIPALQRASERNARVIIQEHRHIRARLFELGAGIDLHIVRLDTARAFIHELRAHARNEDRLLYTWAEQHFDEAHTTSLLDALSAVVHKSSKKTYA